jgi:hypothetical protein
MLSGVPETVRAMKRVIDDGYMVSLTEGLQIEHEAFEAHINQVTQETLAARRAGIQRRG